MNDRTYQMLLAQLKKFTIALDKELPQTETLNADEVYLRIATAIMQLEECAPRVGKAERGRIAAVVRLMKSIAIAQPFFPAELIQK